MATAPVFFSNFRKSGQTSMKRMQSIEQALVNRPAHIIELGGRVHAAVALVLEETPHGLNVLFIQRAANEKDYWSGQIAFPGGRTEPFDASPRDTAERETREELGLDLAAARYLGRLSDIAPGSLQLVVSCFVYGVERHPELQPDRREVANAFWLPLSELDNPARRSRVEFIFRGRLRRFPAVRISEKEGSLLWGLTYRLLRNLHKLISNEKQGFCPAEVTVADNRNLSSCNQRE
jgi:8-oxo-dGTP pyrophosphatase MutT (NUDIX family)